MKNEVFNSSIGNPADFGYPKLTKEEETNILAGLFEQLLIFDKITISTNRLNFALLFLISKLGINTVERLFEYGYIRILLWTPMIISGHGRQKEDGTLDKSTIYGQPPIVAGWLGDKDLDPEENIHNAISQFDLHRDRKRIFTRKIAKHYVVPNGREFSSDSAKLVIDAYENDNLSALGLPFEREANQLEFEQRQQLLGLGNKVVETAIISKYNLKSFENYEYFGICKSNLENIGKAYNVVDNTSEIFKLENLPDLKSFYINEKLNFENIFKLRHLPNAKYYRKWINAVGENSNAQEITKEYLNEIKGSNSFFESNEGKFVKNLGMFGISTALGAALAGPAGAVIGAGVNYGLGLLDTFVLDGILKGKNPSMFINDIRNEIEEE